MRSPIFTAAFQRRRKKSHPFKKEEMHLSIECIIQGAVLRIGMLSHHVAPFYTIYKP